MSFAKADVSRAFAGAAPRYDQFSALQRHIGTCLMSRLTLPQEGSVLLDVGCGTGFLTGQLLAKNRRHQFLALDIAEPMLLRGRHNLDGHTVQWICGDAEKLPLADACIDGLFSNLALQWCLDLPALFSGFKRVLRPGGELAFSSFGPQTLCELKAAWAKVDGYRHVNDFTSTETLRAALFHAGFQQVDIDTQTLAWPYSSVMALMHELKAIGAHRVGTGRNPGPTMRKTLQAMIGHYPRATPEAGITASYQVHYVKARG